MARSAQMNLRVRPALKAKLEKLAKEDRRTLSAYVEGRGHAQPLFATEPLMILGPAGRDDPPK